MQDFISMFFRDRLNQLSLCLDKGLELCVFGSQERGGFVAFGACAGDFAVQGLTTHIERGTT